MKRVEKTVFISYRHTNVFLALAISQNLTHSRFDVFLDYQGIASGDFERVILENIRARVHFLVLLTPSALDRCGTPGDWLRCEIEEALETRRNVVPLMLEGFDFGTPAIASKLTGKLAMLKRYNGMTVPAEYFDAAMTKLRDKFLNVPLEAVLHPASAFAQYAAKEQQTAAAAAPLVQQRELTAEEWFERGFDTSDPDEKIRCWTEAIRLNPVDALAYSNRDTVRDTNGDHDGAVKDYTEALRLQPDKVEAYYARGTVRIREGNYEGAVEDYTEAIRLNPNDADVYHSRGDALQAKGDMKAAQQDFAKANRLGYK